MILIALAAAAQVLLPAQCNNENDPTRPKMHCFYGNGLVSPDFDKYREVWETTCFEPSPSCTIEEDEPKLTFKQWQRIFEQMREANKAEYRLWFREEESLHPDCLLLRQQYGGCP